MAVVAAVGAFWLRTPQVRPPEEVPTPVTSAGNETKAGTAATPPSARAPSPAPHVEDVAVSVADRQKLATLDEVLAARNDNDPRLDIVFRDLTPGTKRLFRERYRALAQERFNERGTIVLLLARELRSPEDAKFLSEVLREPPCRGLRDCRVEDPPDEHAAVSPSTLAYPQLVALAQMQRYFERNDRDPAVVAVLAAELRAAQASTVARVAEYARKIRLPAGE